MWTGSWRNEYGSTLRIDREAGGRLEGRFQTALSDSGFFGAEVPIVGVCQGDCIAFAFTRTGPAGDIVCAFTGLLREGRIHTVWHVTSDSALRADGPGAPARLEKLGWAHANQTNADTFERVNDPPG
ncbi:MAG: hypothetical protein JF588_15730 [Caulobacterales bacterium]|nr:hypothetical protein [Caulobacterales bacterium]